MINEEFSEEDIQSCWPGWCLAYFVDVLNGTYDLEEPDRGDSYYSTASIAWLFCLCGEGYEDRCKMVAEFWKEAKDD